MKKYIFDRPVYPVEIFDDSKKINEKINPLGIEIKFLLEGGILFTVKDEIDIKPSYLGDIAFLKHGKISLIFTENFKNLEFMDELERLIIAIPII